MAQAYLSGTTQRYMGTIGAEIDSVVVIGRGDVELVLYEYVSDACESLQLRASNFAQCRTLRLWSWITIGVICALGVAI